MSKILFFTLGDSNDPSTWSNVPYCFAKALEEEGYQVVRVNLKAPVWISNLWNNTSYRIIRHFQKGCLYGFERTFLARLFMEYRVRCATKANKDAAFSVFTTFACYNRHTPQKPSVLLCDWSLDYYITNRLKRAPYWLERLYIKRESKVIKKAAYVYSLFPNCGQFMQKQMPGAHINYLNQNVLNIIDKNQNLTNLPELKRKSNTILFIGNERYLAGANKLVGAFDLLKEEIPDLRLAFVGLTSKQLGEESDNHRIACHGYLNKSVEADNQTYYQLLRESKIIVNTSGQWAGFSSMIEAMYYFTPVIVSPYDSFVATFGENIAFGEYDREGTARSLAQHVKAICLSDHYDEMCMAAHDATSDFTWSNYVRKLLNDIKQQVRT